MKNANLYPGPCARCGTRVEANAGVRYKAEGRWVTLCASHAPPPETAADACVVLRPLGDGTRALVDIRGRLGAAFGAFREACSAAGATTRKRESTGQWETTVTAAVAPKLVALLQQSGIACEVDPAFAERLAEAADAMHASVAGGEARLAAADAMLAPTGRALRGYQREGVMWLCGRAAQGALLADDMGLGKTAQALTALPNAPRVVVVCPAVAKGVWRREVARWRPGVRAVVLDGRACLGRWPEPGEMLVLNYDVLADAPPPGECPPGVVVIADEAHALKNGKTLRATRFRALASAATAVGGRVWLVTATPLTNRPPELWAVLSAANLAREAFGGWNEFFALMGGTRGEWGTEWTNQIDPSVPERLRRVMLRRDKRDVAKDLPAKSREIRVVSLDKAGEKIVAAAMKELLREGIEPDEVLAALERAEATSKELAGGSVSFEKLSKLRAALATAKIPAVLSIAEEFEEQDEPLVVFSAHREVVDELAARPGWGRISGDESAARKTAVEDAFQRGELRGVAATIRAGGVAITLTRASNVLFVDQDWTPAANNQAEDRVYRIGQTRPVLVQVLQADHPIDARIAELLLEKTVLYKRSVGNARLQAGEVRTEVLAAVPSVESPYDALRFDAVLPNAPIVSRVRRRLYWRDETCAEADVGEAHPPSTPAEEWAASALAQLCADDPDHARERNGVGWSQSDNHYGHTIYRQMQAEGLTDRGWRAALAVLKRYHRQVGRAPQ